MPDNAAYIVDCVRTPVGKAGGSLAEVHPGDLGALVVKTLVERNPIDPHLVDDVIFGCVNQIGAQAGGIGRRVVLGAGLPEEVPGVTLDRACGSSQQAVTFAAYGIMAGQQDVLVAGGVESMSTVPIGSPSRVGREQGLGHPAEAARFASRFKGIALDQFHGAQRIADRWDIGREEMERLALRSHQRAVAAWDEGRFDREVVPVGEVRQDEGPRRDTSLERMAALKPIREGGTLTAAVSSQISDGAAALLIASQRAIDRYGLTPRARLHTMTVVGSDPVLDLSGPIPATRQCLDRAGLSTDDIDLFEVNEAFAPVVLAWAREIVDDPDRTNVNGGAIATGHPVGATGAKLMTTLLHELERRGGRFGLQVMCVGGGQATATIIERVG